MRPTLEPRGLQLPFYTTLISAGFPSPADDYMDTALDLNELLITKPAATFFVRVKGDSMIGAGIHNGDLLIVDRSLEAKNKNIVVAVVNGEFTLKRLVKKGKQTILMPENVNYPPIEITDGMEFQIFGVVAHSIHKVK